MTNNDKFSVSIRAIGDPKKITKPTTKSSKPEVQNKIQLVFEVKTGHYSMQCIDQEINIPDGERSPHVLPQQEKNEMETITKIVYALCFYKQQ